MAKRQEVGVNERYGDYGKVMEKQRNKDGDKGRGQDGELLEDAMNLMWRRVQILELFMWFLRRARGHRATGLSCVSLQKWRERSCCKRETHGTFVPLCAPRVKERE